jgi:2-(1,2-epoxy-1,2-dihydrophenyl)acetyl-CoA isomerase
VTEDPFVTHRRLLFTVAYGMLFVAAVNGPAAGVGLAFALACDVVIASERAVLVRPSGDWASSRRSGRAGS